MGNTSGASVFAYVTLDGGIAPSSLQYTPSTPITVTFTPYNQALFTLPNNQTMTIVNPANGDYLNGNVAFIGIANQPPYFPTYCPDIVNYPNGCNLGEFTINAGSNQETVDVSCVEGVNTTMNISLSGGPGWTDGVTSVTNQGLDVSSQPEGVFPAGCDTCTGSVNPPKCSGTNDVNCPNGKPCCPSNESCWLNFLSQCSTTKCQLNRAGSGGTVTITCQGLLSAWDETEQQEKISAR